LQRIESGEKNLTVRFLAELAPVLKVQPGEFFTTPAARRPRPGRPKKAAVK
jgi:hypothetical protein